MSVYSDKLNTLKPHWGNHPLWSAGFLYHFEMEECCEYNKPIAHRIGKLQPKNGHPAPKHHTMAPSPNGTNRRQKWSVRSQPKSNVAAEMLNHSRDKMHCWESCAFSGIKFRGKILVGRIHFDTFFAWPCVCVCCWYWSKFLWRAFLLK